jgi:hypothetical protein
MPICWPFFEECHRFRMLGPAGVDGLLWGYFTLAVAALLLFTRRWTTPAAYLALLILELVKILIIVQDYRLRLNQHCMAFFVALAFLLFPAKRRVVQYLIVLFYFWAGTIKLNREWLSGASLYRREFLWLPVASGRTGTRRLRLRRGAGDHSGLRPARASSVGLLGDARAARALPCDVVAHRRDARVACEAHVTLHDVQGGTRRVPTVSEGAARTQCDPIVHFNIARALCRQAASNGQWSDLDLSLRSRRTTELDLRPVVEIEGFCRANPPYDVWRANSWIRAE